MPDSQPNYLTTDPNTGKVSANFTGHVSASGVDLPAAITAQSGQPDNQVRWLKQSDGSLVASMVGFDVGPIQGAAITAKSDAPYAGTNLYVEGTTPGNYGKVVATASDMRDGGLSGTEYSVIRDGGLSDFVPGTNIVHKQSQGSPFNESIFFPNNFRYITVFYTVTGYLSAGVGNVFHQLVINNAGIGPTLSFFMNNAGVHTAMPGAGTLDFGGAVAGGSYPVRLDTAAMTRDSNDTFSGIFIAHG